MNIEDKIFQRYSPDFNKLEKYGFRKNDYCFKYDKLFKNGVFKAVIVINSDGQITGTVYDLENDDEFLPLRIGDATVMEVLSVKSVWSMKKYLLIFVKTVL